MELTATGATRSESQRYAAIVDLLSTLTCPTRIVLLEILADGERDVGDLCRVAGISQQLTSIYLGTFRAHDLVQPRRAGKHVHYALTDRGRAMVRFLEDVSAIGGAA